jgi:hypothetical protein
MPRLRKNPVAGYPRIHKDDGNRGGDGNRSGRGWRVFRLLESGFPGVIIVLAAGPMARPFGEGRPSSQIVLPAGKATNPPPRAATGPFLAVTVTTSPRQNGRQ